MYSVGIAAAVGLCFFLIAKLGLALPSSTNFVAVFWPAMGFGVGVLIGLGPSARWPVLAAITVANFLANLSSGDPPQIAAATCISEATECLLPAVLIQRWFGAQFSLGRLRHVLGLLAAAAVGSAAGAVCWIIASRLFHGATGPILITFQHWFMSDMVGFITLGPFVIGLFAALREPPPRHEIIEGVVALVVVAIITGIIILLPLHLWQTALPITWLFPALLWLTARCRPVFAAAAAFLVSITVVSTTVFGIGHFGNPEMTIDDRVLQAQVAILFVALCAFVIAALFAERRESEARLTYSKIMLERERDNKLMNVQAITSAIAHEIRQPLAAIMANASAALRFLERKPPDHNEVRANLKSIISDSANADEVFDSIRALFGKVDHGRQPIDMNEIIREVLASLRGELQDHDVETHPELTSEMPPVHGHKGQLREVIFNLVHNAIEAMHTTTGRSRTLWVKTTLSGNDAIVVSVKDSGPGIDQEQLKGVFAAFVTTKAHGTGLGLAICRMIIEHHGGQIFASSDGKNGALFQFALPIQPNLA
jgi:signal transduction histidine kinase